MTEEIIINGVNVAECEHYCEKLDTGSGIIQNTSKQGFCLHNITGLHNADIYFRVLSFPKCREQSNCYFKQLKRLEQDSKQLTQWLDEARNNADFWCNKCTILEQENKELKKDVQLFKCLDTFGENECHCACRCLGNEFCEDADKKINKYRSALKEIKKIITTDCKRCTAECDCDDDCTRYKIKNKINEVLGC